MPHDPSPYQMCPVSHVLSISCFMRLLNLQPDLLLYQMSDPKKSHGVQLGLRSYSVYQVIILRPLSLRCHVTTTLHDQTDYAGVTGITGAITQSIIELFTDTHLGNVQYLLRLYGFLYCKSFLILLGDPDPLINSVSVFTHAYTFCLYYYLLICESIYFGRRNGEQSGQFRGRNSRPVTTGLCHGLLVCPFYQTFCLFLHCFPISIYLMVETQFCLFFSSGVPFGLSNLFYDLLLYQSWTNML